MPTSRNTPRPTDRVPPGSAASAAGGHPVRVGLGGAGALAALFVVDTLFLNPPTTGPGREVDAGDD